MTYLQHHGIEGQKWGRRRYQYEDGSLTPEGKIRYSDKQRKRDERIYGKAAAKRIEKRVRNGESIQSARHPETGHELKRYQEHKEGTKLLVRGSAKVVGGTAATAVGMFIKSQNKPLYSVSHIGVNPATARYIDYYSTKALTYVLTYGGSAVSVSGGTDIAKGIIKKLA